MGMLKIVWAIDAFDLDPALQASIANLIRILARSTGAAVQPAYLFTPKGIFKSLKHFESEVQLHINKAKESLEGIAERAHVPNLLPHRVIFDRADRRLDATMALCKFALRERADLIAVAARESRSLKRILSGSFSEALVLTSPISVLSARAKTPVGMNLRDILFSTDLSPYASQCFNQVLPVAKSLNAKVTVFHSAPIPGSLPVQDSIRPYEELRRAMPFEWSKEFLKRRHALGSYQERAEKNDVEATILIDASGLDLASAIQSAVERYDIDLVALPARRRKHPSAWSGGTLRRIARIAPCPVWVLHETWDDKPVRTAA